jgi:hypothetical protein
MLERYVTCKIARCGLTWVGVPQASVTRADHLSCNFHPMCKVSHVSPNSRPPRPSLTEMLRSIIQCYKHDRNTCSAPSTSAPTH